MRRLIFFFCLFLPLLTFAATLKERVERAESGDFVVMSQGKSISVLLIRFLSKNSLVLEEITAPEKQPLSWKEWVEKGAPGHTSWVMYEIDLTENRLIECYSPSQRRWLFVDEAGAFLPKLLSLDLALVPKTNRKRIGPPPLAGEPDQRALWTPPFVVGGIKKERPQVESWQGLWPNDGSKLEACQIELYFEKETPLPIWIEVKSPHYAFKIRTVDSGKQLSSPAPHLPKRPPQFIGSAKKAAGILRLQLRSPAYYKEFHLFAIDQTSSLKETIPLPCEIKKTGEMIELLAHEEILKKLLTAGHRYRFAVVPKGASDVYVEMDELFTWNSK